MLLSFAIASLVAVASGCLVTSSAGVSPRVWVPNTIAWVLGAGLAPLIARAAFTPLLRAVVLLGIVSMLMSFFDAGIDGVHRWVALGPLRWNVAFLCLPAVAVALTAAANGGLRWAWWAALIIEGMLWFQPDASQATAFAAAMIVGPFSVQPRRFAHLGATLIFALIAAAAWTRPDPLAPVPHVEGILGMAAARSTWMAIVCLTSLVAAAASPLMARRSGRPLASASAAALSVYFFVCSVMPFCGAFPVPLVGMGMSPVLGFWLGIGMLVAVSEFAKSPSEAGAISE